jgi:hypothetical protein
MTYFDAIRLVEDGTASFYITRGGLRIELIVVNNAWGYKCLRARDDATTEVLLSLPTSIKSEWSTPARESPPDSMVPLK